MRQRARGPRRSPPELEARHEELVGGQLGVVEARTLVQESYAELQQTHDEVLEDLCRSRAGNADLRTHLGDAREQLSRALVETGALQSS